MARRADLSEACRWDRVIFELSQNCPSWSAVGRSLLGAGLTGALISSKSLRTTLKRQCVKPLGEWHELNAGLSPVRVPDRARAATILWAAISANSPAASLRNCVYFNRLQATRFSSCAPPASSYAAAQS